VGVIDKDAFHVLGEAEAFEICDSVETGGDLALNLVHQVSAPAGIVYLGFDARPYMGGIGLQSIDIHVRPVLQLYAEAVGDAFQHESLGPEGLYQASQLVIDLDSHMQTARNLLFSNSGKRFAFALEV
jgi:hypothetical protein